MSTTQATHKYLVTVRHDNGVARLTVTAQSADAAKRIVMSAEGCPERSIVNVVAC